MHSSPLPPPAPSSTAPAPRPTFADALGTPSAPDVPLHAAVAQNRPGRLTPGWRSWFISCWVLIVAGLGFVWASSRTIGLSTWWLGPEANPRSILIQVLPLIAPVVACLCGFRNVRYAALIGMAAAAAMAAIGLGDLDRVRNIALVELALAASGLLISVASLAGTYRRAR